MKFMGYERPDGTVGIRNLILVMAVADCSEPVARQIAEKVEGRPLLVPPNRKGPKVCTSTLLQP